MMVDIYIYIYNWYTLWYTKSLLLKMDIEILYVVDLPNSMGFLYVYQNVIVLVDSNDSDPLLNIRETQETMENHYC